MALPKASHTVMDLIAMPEHEEGERHELIDGELYVTPVPVVRHQRVSSNLIFHLETHVRSGGLGLVLDNSAVRVDDHSYVVPDAMFILRERRRIISAEGISEAPDLVCEILSPSTRRRDLLTKRAFYERIGVREYWIIDPDALEISVLALEDGRYVRLTTDPSGAIPSRVLPQLRLTLTELFEDVAAILGPDSTSEGM